MNKRNKKKLIISFIVATIILIGVFGTFKIMKDLKQEDILRAEINNISKKNITTDRYNTPIKTTKDYAVVEKTIKEYLDDYAVTLQSLLKIMDDNKLNTLLSAENYKKDGPNFSETKKYISETKSDFNTKLDKLTNMTSEEEILKQINDKKLDKYYVDLYSELMLRGIAEDDFKNSQADLKDASDKINNIFNVEEKVINLLVSNNGKWQVDNDKIVFQNTDTLNEYNELIKQLTN